MAFECWDASAACWQRTRSGRHCSCNCSRLLLCHTTIAIHCAQHTQLLQPFAEVLWAHWPIACHKALWGMCAKECFNLRF